MAEQVLGTLVVRLAGDASRFESMLARSNSSLKVFAGAMAASFVGVTLAAVKAASSLNEKLERTEASFGRLGVAMRGTFEGVLSGLSNKTGTGISQLADGVQALHRAGLDAAFSIKAIGVAEEFAKANGLELGQASRDLAEAQKLLNMNSPFAGQNEANMRRVGDLFTRVFHDTGRSIGEVLELLRGATPEAISEFRNQLALVGNESGKTAEQLRDPFDLLETRVKNLVVTYGNIFLPALKDGTKVLADQVEQWQKWSGGAEEAIDGASAYLEAFWETFGKAAMSNFKLGTAVIKDALSPIGDAIKGLMGPDMAGDLFTYLGGGGAPSSPAAGKGGEGGVGASAAAKTFDQVLAEAEARRKAARDKRNADSAAKEQSLSGAMVDQTKLRVDGLEKENRKLEERNRLLGKAGVVHSRLMSAAGNPQFLRGGGGLEAMNAGPSGGVFDKDTGWLGGGLTTFEDDGKGGRRKRKEGSRNLTGNYDEANRKVLLETLRRRKMSYFNRLLEDTHAGEQIDWNDFRGGGSVEIKPPQLEGAAADYEKSGGPGYSSADTEILNELRRLNTNVKNIRLAAPLR